MVALTMTTVSRQRTIQLPFAWPQYAPVSMTREGRASDKAILTSRLIDRPIRPLFPKGLYNDVTVIATVLSVDVNISPEVLGMIGSSVALSISDIPFAGCQVHSVGDKI